MRKIVLFFMLLCLIMLFSCTFDEDLIGTWAQEASWIVEEQTFEARVVFIFEEEDIEMLFYGQDDGWVLLPDGSFRGTYTVDGDIISVTLTEMMIGGVWEPSSDEGSAQYDITGDQMDLIIDYDGDEEYDDSYPFDETFPGGEGPMTDILFELTKE